MFTVMVNTARGFLLSKSSIYVFKNALFINLLGSSTLDSCQKSFHLSIGR